MIYYQSIGIQHWAYVSIWVFNLIIIFYMFFLVCTKNDYDEAAVNFVKIVEYKATTIERNLHAYLFANYKYLFIAYCFKRTKLFCVCI